MDHNHRPGRVTTAVESRALGTHCSLFFARKVNSHIDYINCANKSAYIEKVVIICCCVVVFLINRVKTNDNLYIAHKLTQFLNFGTPPNLFLAADIFF